MKLRICGEEEFERYYNERDYRPVDENDTAVVEAFREEFDHLLDKLDELYLSRGLTPMDGDEGDFSIHPNHNYTRVADTVFQSQTEQLAYFDPALWQAIQELLKAEKLDWLVVLQEADYIFITQSEVIGYSSDVEEFLSMMAPGLEIEGHTG